MQMHEHDALLHTSRLLLRPLQETDEDFIYSLRSNEQVNRFIDRAPAKNIEDAKTFIKKISEAVAEYRSYYWGIILRETNTMIGTICVWNFSDDRKSAELGYELHPDFQGSGYMDEAMKEVIGFVFRSGLARLEAQTHKDNVASTKLLLKNGFVRDETAEAPEATSTMRFALAKDASRP
jgi:ribosomal-protein-alanine N-acetyltransferase